jgi:uncharacterized protein YndB with AHSA1/START domain
MSKVIRKERLYPVPPNVVWEALTNPAALAEWLMPNNFTARQGASFEFLTDPTPVCGSGVTRCEVVELDPCRRMVWTWRRDAGAKGGAPLPMTVAWTLSAEGTGTRLVLEQTGLESQNWLVGVLMSIGWGMMLRRSLPRVIANVSRDGAARFTPGAIPLAKRYYRCKSVPMSHLHLTAPAPI